jgi:hypothetical protein
VTSLEAEWTPVKHLILGDDPQLRLYADLSVWFKKIELFRKGEEQRMFLQQPTQEDRRVHKSLLQRLIADGDHLLLLIQQVGLPANVEGLKPEDAAAALETLRDSYRGWHEPVSAERQTQILEEVFPDVT